MYLKNRVINGAIRGGTILTRFLFYTLLAKELGLEILGYFSEYQSYIIFMALVGGMDLYTYTSRDKTEIKNKLYTKHFLTIFIYSLVAITIFVLINKFTLKLSNFKTMLFVLTLLSEVLIQDVYRLSIFNNKQILASLIQLFKTLLMPIIVIFLIIRGNRVTLEQMYIIWFVCNLLITAVLFIKFRNNLTLISIRELLVFIKKSIKTSTGFISSSLFNRSIFTFDKTLLRLNQSDEYVGSYSYTLSILMAFYKIYDAIIAQFYYPNLVKCKGSEKKKIFKEFQYNTYGFVFIFILTSIIMFPLFGIFGIDLYLMTYILLLIFVTIFILSHTYHYLLYSMDIDKIIIVSSISATIIFYICFFIAPYNYSLEISFIIYSSTIFLLKYIKHKKLIYE